jgi:hypothetical protein
MMGITVKKVAGMAWLAFGAAFLGTMVSCTGPLVYRPEKKEEPVLATGNHLPPAPDRKANDATLAGIDTTGLGLRDDVHIWIYSNYSSTAKRRILTGMAKTYQSLLLTPAKTKEEAKKFQHNLDSALLALQALPGTTAGEASAMDDSLYGETVDTPARLRIFLRYYMLLGN